MKYDAIAVDALNPNIGPVDDPAILKSLPEVYEELEDFPCAYRRRYVLRDLVGSGFPTVGVACL